MSVLHGKVSQADTSVMQHCTIKEADIPPPCFVLVYLYFGKRILAKSANGAYPIIGYIFKCGAGCNAAVGITYSRIIDIATGAFKFFHKLLLLTKIS